jgi:transposase
MESVSVEVGIDVSRAFLDVSLGGAKPFRVPNTPESCLELAERLPSGSVVHLEASGGCERIPRRVLTDAGLTVRTLDPLRVRRMAQAKGKRGKTDSLDAMHLAVSGGSLEPQREKTRFREELCDLSRAIEDIKQDCACLKVKAGVPGLDGYTRDSLLEGARLLRRLAEEMHREHLRRIKGSEQEARHALAVSVPGVGPVLARVACCEIPESFEQFSDAQLTSYAGVAPVPDQSGDRKPRARVRRGNSRLKAALYMPAICCVRSQEWARSLYKRLRARGRAHQQAIVAVMRRLLIRILQVLRRGTPWVVKQMTT